MNQWIALSETGALSNAHAERPSGADVFLNAPYDHGIGAEFTPQRRSDITRLRSKRQEYQQYGHSGSLSSREKSPRYTPPDVGRYQPLSAREPEVSQYIDKVLIWSTLLRHIANYIYFIFLY